MTRLPQVIGAVLLLFGTTLAGCAEPPYESPFLGDEEVPAPTVSGVTLVDSNNTSWSLDLMRGDVLVVAFIFTRCPDVCLATESNMIAISNHYPADNRSNLTFISIALDPWSDTAADMDGFADTYGADWLHLTAVGAGTADQGYPDLEVAWSRFGIGVRSYEHGDDDYLIDHSAPIILVDKNLDRRVAWMPDHLVVEDVAHDIDLLLAE